MFEINKTDPIKVRIDESSSQEFFNALVAWSQIIVAIVGVVTLLALIKQIAVTYRPMLSMIIEKDGEGNEKLVLKNIGNRPAIKVEIKSRWPNDAKKFNLDVGESKRIDWAFSFITGVRYRRNSFSLLWFSRDINPQEGLFSKVLAYKPSDRLRSPTGRKKLRKFLQSAAKFDWASDNISLHLFAANSVIAIKSFSSVRDPTTKELQIRTFPEDILYELEAIFGESNDSDQEGNAIWQLDKVTLKNKIKARYKSPFDDFKDTTDKVEVSVKSVYESLSGESKIKKRIINDPKIFIAEYDSAAWGRSRAVSVAIPGVDTFGTLIRTSKRICIPDASGSGFVISNSRRDAVLSQRYKQTIGDTIVLTSGITFTGDAKALRTIQLTRKQYELLSSSIKAALELPDPDKIGLIKAIKKKLILLYDYVYFSFDRECNY